LYTANALLRIKQNTWSFQVVLSTNQEAISDLASVCFPALFTDCMLFELGVSHSSSHALSYAIGREVLEPLSRKSSDGENWRVLRMGKKGTGSEFSRISFGEIS